MYEEEEEEEEKEKEGEGERFVPDLGGGDASSVSILNQSSVRRGGGSSEPPVPLVPGTERLRGLTRLCLHS